MNELKFKCEVIGNPFIGYELIFSSQL